MRVGLKPVHRRILYAMNELGWEAGECRLPLVEPGDAHKEQIEQALQAAGLIKEYTILCANAR